jgi:hypothetical protein
MTDRHLDLTLGYFEAIYWRKVDAGELQPSGSVTAVFRQRGFWAAKNPAQQTSRDRFLLSAVERDIGAFESALSALGFGPAYCQGIRQKVTRGLLNAHAQFLYRAALRRTLAAKQTAVAA